MTHTLRTPSSHARRGTDLYRFYDEDDRLLYVGISLNAAKRASEHRADKAWWPDVQRMEVEHLDATRIEAEQIEKLAIIQEQPIHNITHSVRSSSRPNDGIVEFDATTIMDYLTALEEWQAVGHAINTLGQMCDSKARAGEEVGTRQQFLDVINGLARAVVFASWCEGCTATRYPVGIRFTSSTYADVAYICGDCRLHWSVNWTTDLAMLAVL